MEMAWRPTIVRVRAAVLLQRADVCRVGKKILIKGHANIIGDETGSAQCSVTKTALPRAQTSPYGAHRVTKRVSCVLNCIRSVVMVGSLFGGSLKVSPKDVPVAQFDPQQTGGPKLAVLAGGCFWSSEERRVGKEGVSRWR